MRASIACVGHKVSRSVAEGCALMRSRLRVEGSLVDFGLVGVDGKQAAEALGTFADNFPRPLDLGGSVPEDVEIKISR